MSNMEKYKAISNLLAKWNPLGVPESIATDEYLRLVPPILKTGNELDLELLLKQYMGTQYGIDFNNFTADDKIEF